jgi:hypothetical protein
MHRMRLLAGWLVEHPNHVEHSNHVKCMRSTVNNWQLSTKSVTSTIATWQVHIEILSAYRPFRAKPHLSFTSMQSRGNAISVHACMQTAELPQTSVSDK